MSKICLPGFTAEMSLYKTSELYHAAKVENASGLVYPAQFSFVGPLCKYQRCIRGIDSYNRPIWGDCCVTRSLPDWVDTLSSCWVLDPRIPGFVNRCLYFEGR